jgi:hypothetical protein
MWHKAAHYLAHGISRHSSSQQPQGGEGRGGLFVFNHMGGGGEVGRIE